MSEKLLGLHHVTAIAGNARQVVESYGQIPGIKLVKRTVNYDDPGSYHLYFGAGNGTPGSLLTFFPWATAAHPEGRLGTPGSGQISGVAMGRNVDAPDVFTDPPRLLGITLCEADAGPTIAFLRDTLGVKQLDANKLELADGAFFDVLHSPEKPRGKMERASSIMWLLEWRMRQPRWGGARNCSARECGSAPCGIASTSTRSTSASLEACFWRSPPTAQASRSMSRRNGSARDCVCRHGWRRRGKALSGGFRNWRPNCQHRA